MENSANRFLMNFQLSGAEFNSCEARDKVCLIIVGHINPI